MKKVFLMITTCLMMLSFCSCSAFFGETNQTIEDKNGDDTSLAVLGEKELTAEFPESYCLVAGVSTSGGTSYKEETFHDGDIAEAYASSPFSGVGIIQLTYGKSDKVRFTVNAKLSAGNLKVYLFCLTDLTIVHEFKIGEKSSYLLENAKDKEFELRVAGESAEYEIEVNREFLQE